MGKQASTALSLGLGAAILYLGAHAVTGRQGLVAYVALQAEERALERQIQALEAQELALDQRARRLRPGDAFDEDYLAERARITLAAGEPDEIVFSLD